MAQDLAADIARIIPPEKSAFGAETLEMGGKTLILETANQFKLFESIRIVSEIVKSVEMNELMQSTQLLADGQQNQNTLFMVAGLVRLLPMLSERAATLVNELAALLSMTNAELHNAYRKGNNELQKAIQERKEWLLFECDAGASFTIIEAYWPTLRLDALKNALTPMLGRIGKMLSTPPSSASTSL